MTTMPPEFPPGGPFDPIAPIPAPPGHWVGPPLANWPKRAVGALIDGVIVSVPYWVLIKLGSFGLALVVLTAGTAYLQYLQGKTGQTPGKRVMHTKLLREADGLPLGFGVAFGRALLHIVDVLPCLVGFAWPWWDAKKQTFADKIVESVVIEA
jgi:uncharacterized RDD family membrane protein YckC